MSDNTKYLLPVGFYDLLSDEARINHQAVNSIIDRFYSFGYQLIKTPLVEFEKSLDNRRLCNQSFRMIDLFSNRNLALRSDITPQIVRLVHTKFNNCDLPLRLCYTGDVLRVKSSDLYPDRQLTQAGIELIGSNSVLANWEVLHIILAAINSNDLDNLIIDFCLPGLLGNLLNAIGLNNSGDLANAIVTKNISAISKLGGKYKDVLIRLALGGHDFSKIKSDLIKLPLDAVQKRMILNLELVVDNVRNHYPQIEILFNIFGDSDFLYHEELAFTIFERDFVYPIARGGKYRIDSDISASGATIYVNNMRRIMRKISTKNPPKILIPENIDTKEIKALQRQGYITVFALGNTVKKAELITECRKTGCNFLYFARKITEIR